MKPCQLEHNMNSKHKALANKPLGYFERLLSEMKSEKLEMKKVTNTGKSLLSASYLIALTPKFELAFGKANCRLLICLVLYR